VDGAVPFALLMAFVGLVGLVLLALLVYAFVFSEWGKRLRRKYKGMKLARRQYDRLHDAGEEAPPKKKKKKDRDESSSDEEASHPQTSNFRNKMRKKYGTMFTKKEEDGDL